MRQDILHKTQFLAAGRCAPPVLKLMLECATFSFKPLAIRLPTHWPKLREYPKSLSLCMLIRDIVALGGEETAPSMWKIVDGKKTARSVWLWMKRHAAVERGSVI
jgi:hypothetical protein